jgi:hypothetical protein
MMPGKAGLGREDFSQLEISLAQSEVSHFLGNKHWKVYI